MVLVTEWRVTFGVWESKRVRKPSDDFLSEEKEQYWTIYWWNVSPFIAPGTVQKR